MVWHDKKWKDKRPLSAIQKTSGTELPREGESMPVAIIPSQHRLLANRASKTPYSEIVQAWYAPMSADTRAAYSKDLELWARSMKASLAELAALCIESPQDAYKTAILRRAGEISQDQKLATSTRLRKLASLRSWVDHMADYRADSYRPAFAQKSRSAGSM